MIVFTNWSWNDGFSDERPMSPLSARLLWTFQNSLQCNPVQFCANVSYCLQFNVQLLALCNCAFQCAEVAMMAISDFISVQFCCVCCAISVSSRSCYGNFRILCSATLFNSVQIVSYCLQSNVLALCNWSIFQCDEVAMMAISDFISVQSCCVCFCLRSLSANMGEMLSISTGCLKRPFQISFQI